MGIAGLGPGGHYARYKPQGGKEIYNLTKEMNDIVQMVIKGTKVRSVSKTSVNEPRP